VQPLVLNVSLADHHATVCTRFDKMVSVVLLLDPNLTSSSLNGSTGPFPVKLAQALHRVMALHHACACDASTVAAQLCPSSASHCAPSAKSRSMIDPTYRSAAAVSSLSAHELCAMASIPSVTRTIRPLVLQHAAGCTGAAGAGAHVAQRLGAIPRCRLEIFELTRFNEWLAALESAPSVGHPSLSTAAADRPSADYGRIWASAPQGPSGAFSASLVSTICGTARVTAMDSGC